MPPQRSTNLGSGVIVAAEGYVLTNHHVIEGADDIQLVLADGRRVVARVRGTDPETDLAVLKADAADLPAITFGDLSQVQVGDVVLAIGNPFGFGNTVTLRHRVARSGARSSASTATRTSSRPTRRSTRATRAARWSTRRAG